MTDMPPVPLEVLAQADDLLDTFVDAQAAGPLSTPDIMETLANSELVGRDIARYSVMLAVAIARLGAIRGTQ